MKPNFKKMSRSDLKEYIKNNHTDDEAIKELFVNRKSPDAVRYPCNLSDEEMKRIFTDKIQQES